MFTRGESVQRTGKLSMSISVLKSSSQPGHDSPDGSVLLSGNAVQDSARAIFRY